MSEELKDIELKSEEVTEILSVPPKWIFRWGISVIFILIITGIALTYFIRYPDILTANMTLTTLNPPVQLTAKTEGKLSALLVQNNQTVKKEQIIAVIENTANYNDVLYLQQQCDTLNNQLKINDNAIYFLLKDSLHTGELTPYYLQVLKTLKDANLYKEVNPYNQQITLLKKDLLNYSSLLVKYKNQENINHQQLQLSENDYNRDKKLFEDKAISAREFENKKKEYLSAMSSNEQVKITYSNTLLQVNAIEKNILQLQIQDYQEQSKIKTELQQFLKTLLSEIDKWKQQFLIESPVEGKISFFNVWAVHQQIKQSEVLFSIVPNQEQIFIGKCILPITNTGKLTLNQKVNIKLDNYPFAENGLLQGEVKNISAVPNQNNLMIDVQLTNGLTTTYHKTLPYKEQMTGTADIITQNLSVMDRIFFSFKKLMETN